MRYFSNFLRALVLQKDKSTSLINKEELVRQIDGIGIQIGRIGNNINQIAKYANIQSKSGKVDPDTMIKFNTQMEYYLKEQRKLINAYRGLVRNKE